MSDDLAGETELSIPAAFRAAETAMRRMEAKYLSGEWGEREYADGLAKVIVNGGDYEWTIGAATGSWYRRQNGGAWEAATPPARS